MAVESGRTRCPRCMSWTEYRFLDRGDNALEYQVPCTSCGNLHTEVTVLSPAGPAAA